MPSLCLLCVAMLVRALALWVNIQQDSEEEPEKEGNKKKELDVMTAEEDIKEEDVKEKYSDSETELPGDKSSKEVATAKKMKQYKEEPLNFSVVNIGTNYLLVHVLGYAVMNSPLLFSQIGK